MERHLQARLELLSKVGGVWDVPRVRGQVILIFGCFQLQAAPLKHHTSLSQTGTRQIDVKFSVLM